MSGGLVAATTHHADAIALILENCFGAEAWPAASIVTSLENTLAFGWLTASGGVALARTVADEAELLTIAVVPAARRSGLGRMLLGAVLAEARDRGATTLFLEVAADNEGARALYCSAGFRKIGERRHYYGAGRDAWLLSRSLCE